MNLQALPKVVLHDHLDGALRPQTVAELAAETGYTGLPTTDPDALTEFFDQGNAGSLVEYLRAFDHTVAVMQTTEAISRVAEEAGEDVAADGAIYAELRFAPSLCTARGLRIEDVIEAALHGLERAETRLGIALRLIVVAMRDRGESETVAAAAVRYRGDGVVGFDIAGPETGNPATAHERAIQAAHTGGLGITIHAGEADGPQSVAAALTAGAQRIGHGVRVVEDCTIDQGQIVEFGPVATAILQSRTPLEICPTSNLHTAGWEPDEHPVGLLHRAGFVVTISPDNRLMSATSATAEFELLVHHQGFGLEDLEQVSVQAAQAAFCDQALRDDLLAAVRSGYRAALTNSMMS